MSEQAAAKINIFCCFSSCFLWKKLRSMTIPERNRFYWNSFGYKTKTLDVPPTFELLITLYDGKDIVEGLESCRINPDFTSTHHSRNDLEYYIPQLTNFMIFHQDVLCNKLNSFLEEVSMTDPYFAHSYHWYINSFELGISQEKLQAILNQLITKCSEGAQAQLFVKEYEKFFQAVQNKIPHKEFDTNLIELQARKLEVSSNNFISTLLFFQDLSNVAEDVTRAINRNEFLNKCLKEINKKLPSCIYIPFVKDSIRHYAVLNIVIAETRIYSTKERAPFYLCMELFKPQEFVLKIIWHNIIRELAHEYNELFKIRDIKKEKKKNLIDWAKKKFQLSKILSRGDVNVQKETNEIDNQFNIDQLNAQISNPRTLKKSFLRYNNAACQETQRTQEGGLLTNELMINIEGHHSDDGSHSGIRNSLEGIPGQEDHKATEKEDHLPIPNFTERMRAISSDNFKKTMELESHEENKALEEKLPVLETQRQRSFTTKPSTFRDLESSRRGLEFKIDLNEPLYTEEAHRIGTEKEHCGDEKISRTLSQEEITDIFGEDSKDQNNRIRQASPFKHLKSWRLVHLILKKGADMKEEQFAIQLISQFDQIFKAEKLKLILTPYEIISLGGDFGLVEVAKDAVTISRLKEKMYNQGIANLNEFFVKYYGAHVETARKKFCRSLAAYSLVCYFLQIKDRHNGNIMFHKEGHILHIDFGFFLSNSPGLLGKGIEFERKVPFKLLNEYVEVLGGLRSSLFQEFRKLFYQGFMAARKNREQILILVKMMYSSQGNNLPCFKAGMRSIIELEQRFCPPNVQEKDLKNYCYNLINQSLDNWRAKCYDKYQYHFQGIFY